MSAYVSNLSVSLLLAVWRVCFFPLPTPCGIRIGASDDLPMRRNRPFHGRGPFPCGRRPRCLLSLESDREFLITRTVGWKIGPVSWWCAPLSSAQSMRRRRIPLWGMPGGKSAERPGASEASEPAGAKPPRGGASWLSTGGSYPQRKISNSLNFSFRGEFSGLYQWVGRRNP